MMNEQHNKLIIDDKLVSEKEQNDLSSKNPSSTSGPLSIDTLNALIELGEVLRRIRKRMKSEGFDIIDGKVCKIEKPK